MVTAVTRNNLCDSNPQWIRAIEEMIFETVIFFRQRGHKRDIAIEQASLALGLTQRRTWSIFYEQPFAITRDEYAAIRERFARHLEFQADAYARQSEIVRAKLRQMELDV